MGGNLFYNHFSGGFAGSTGPFSVQADAGKQRLGAAGA